MIEKGTRNITIIEIIQKILFLTIDKNESKYFRKYLPNKIFNIINIGYQRLSNNWKKIKLNIKKN